MRGYLTAAVCAAVSLMGSRFSYAETLTLQTPGPAAIVHISSSSISNATGDCYAGVLNWTSNSSAATYHTFCVDINHDIGIGGNYSYNLNNTFAIGQEHPNEITPGLILTSQMINSVYYLWQTYLVTNSSNTSSSPVTFSDAAYAAVNSSVKDANQTAAAFQLAIWDVLYDNPAFLNSPLKFDTTTAYGALNITNAAISAGNSWASAAWNAGSVSQKVQLDMFQATEPNGSATGAQDQVYFVGIESPAPLATPLPTSVAGGVGTFLLFGAGGLMRRKLSVEKV